MASPSLRRLCLLGCCLVGTAGFTAAFQPSLLPISRASSVRSSSSLQDCAAEVEECLASNYPSASALFAKNGNTMKAIVKSEDGFTIFAPNEAAFKDLGDKKRMQLEDVRNDEMAEKVASYHVILEPVTAEQLFNSGGVVTEGGEVLSERSVSGGFMGIGGKEVR